jgi:hypothetical protein
LVEFLTPKKALQPSRWDETASRYQNPHLKMRAILIGSSGTKCGQIKAWTHFLGSMAV